MTATLRTLPQVQAAQSEAWMYGAIVVVVALVLAILIAHLINWRSDRRDFITRRVWFILIGIIAPAGHWIYCLQEVAPQIQNAGMQNMYKDTALEVLLASLACYFLVGLVLMLVFRNTKLGSILGRKKQ